MTPAGSKNNLFIAIGPGFWYKARLFAAVSIIPPRLGKE